MLDFCQPRPAGTAVGLTLRPVAVLLNVQLHCHNVRWESLTLIVATNNKRYNVHSSQCAAGMRSQVSTQLVESRLQTM